MSRRKILLAVLVLVLAVAGIAIGLAVERSGGSETPSRSFAVPARVQRTIEHDYAQLAYLPTRLPPRLHYTSYDGVRGFELTISFSRPGTTSNDVEYTVLAANCATQGTPMLSFRLNGVDVSWSGTAQDQRAWSCVTRGPTALVVSAGRSVVGDANPGGGAITSKVRRHALELAQVVASAEPLP